MKNSLKKELLIFQTKNLMCLIGIAWKLNVNYPRQKLPIVFYIMQNSLNGRMFVPLLPSTMQ